MIGFQILNVKNYKFKTNHTSLSFNCSNEQAGLVVHNNTNLKELTIVNTFKIASKLSINQFYKVQKLTLKDT